MLTIFIQHSTGSPSQSNQTGKKKIKDIQIGREEVKLPLFADGMILCIEKPKDSTKKLLKVSMNLVNLQDTKSVYKCVPFLYTSNKLSERDLIKKIPFIISSERIK